MALAKRNVTTRDDLSDPEIFGAFYDQALPVVYGYFLRRTGGMPALTEDLTQETFLAAVKQIQRGAVVDAPRPWLIGIARHRLIDHYRASAVQPAASFPWETGLAITRTIGTTSASSSIATRRSARSMRFPHHSGWSSPCAISMD